MHVYIHSNTSLDTKQIACSRCCKHKLSPLWQSVSNFVQTRLVLISTTPSHPIHPNLKFMSACFTPCSQSVCFKIPRIRISENKATWLCQQGCCLNDQMFLMAGPQHPLKYHTSMLNASLSLILSTQTCQTQRVEAGLRLCVI